MSQVQPNWKTLQAMLHCHYKAWQLAKDNSPSLAPPVDFNTPLQLPLQSLTPGDKLVLTALYSRHLETITVQQIKIVYANGQPATLKLRLNSTKARKLLQDTLDIISQDAPPPFYKNAHCPDCFFQDACYQKLNERNCISLLTGIPPKVILKFHKKGIYSIQQLAHLFRPRRRRRHPQASTNYLWELKALAITEQKTFVLYPPDVKETPVSIYIDFEGLPEEHWVYLAGVIIVKENGAHTPHTFWADNITAEKEIFIQLLDLLKQYPEATIYHYGSYETKSLQWVQKKYPELKNEITALLPRLFNLLSLLRTHIYPPVYGNGLKEVAGWLGFKWNDLLADGKQSIQWRKDWEAKRDNAVKETLTQYNLDDCKALLVVKEWFTHLAKGTIQENIQQVAEMKKQSLYKFQNNPELGDDFQHISKAAYFDYQRTKIYWRNKESLSAAAAVVLHPKSGKKGTPVWQPPKIHETVSLIPLTACPKCGASKVYHYKQKRKVIQTDLKFTATGIRQHVIAYIGTKSVCSQCRYQYNDQVLRGTQYGDNLFAYVTYLYINYNISNYLISSMMQEQFGIWISPMYLVMRKQKWWQQWEPEVQYIWEIIRHSPVIHIDETSVHLEQKSGYVWVFATTHTVFYHYTDTREGSFLHEWLKDYKGIIVTDIFPAYESLPVIRQKCLIHLVRDLNDDLFKNPFDEEYKAIVMGFNELLRKIITTIDRYGLKQAYLKKHLKDTEYFLQRFIEVPYKSELAAKCVKRFQKHWQQLWTFLQYDGVPWNNNNAEAAVKAFAQYRRGVKGMIGEKGLREYLKMLSLAQTCRYRNIRFLSFLRRKSGIWENVHPDVLPGYLPFNQARQYVHKLKMEKHSEWVIWEQAGKRPLFIPLHPEKVYKDAGWVNWADWAGCSFWPFEKARTYMRRLGLKNSDEYHTWLKSKKRPRTIPHEPAKVYKHSGWNGLGDWLGTGNIQNQRKKKMSYDQAKAYVQAIGIRSWEAYIQWSKSGERPVMIPAAPDKAYREFESWGKFLGTDRIANQHKIFRSYEEAKAFLAPLQIRSKNAFISLCKKGSIPSDIPRDPKIHYTRMGSWISFKDFFGQ
jgi:predicted RecB family nuclease